MSPQRKKKSTPFEKQKDGRSADVDGVFLYDTPDWSVWKPDRDVNPSTHQSTVSCHRQFDWTKFKGTPK